MGKLFTILFLMVLLLGSNCVCCQTVSEIDSTAEVLSDVPIRYITSIDKKIDKYSGRINSRTIKTLTRLSKWEEKIKLSIEKVNPDLAKRLFGMHQVTFAMMLQKYQSGEMVIRNYKGRYDNYTDKLKINLKYLSEHKTELNKKVFSPLKETRQKLDSLTEESAKMEALQQLIKERKKQLLETAYKILGKNKYISKINKEAWYYAETLRNYKEIFKNPDKTEKTVKDILSKVPAFQKFAQKNSQLASILGLAPGLSSNTSSGQIVSGLQSSTGVQSAMRASMGNNSDIQQVLQQNVQHAQAEIKRIKDKLNKEGGHNDELTMPNFKPNVQKTKTFWQRLEYGTDIQFGRSNNLLPPTSDISFSIGYKLDNNKTVGLGASYKLGLGTVDNIKFSNQGIGLRSYLDLKIKKQLSIAGGFEMNYNNGIKKIPTLKNASCWQQAALIGLSKKLSIQTKWFKATKFQLLFDLLSRQHVPVSQSVILRIGYNF